jgi:trk system potassium uptake protein TrkA
LGFSHVVTKIEDEELEHICTELGLENTIIPTRTISRLLTDMASGRDILELSTMMKGEARFFSFIAREEDEGGIGDLNLPDEAKVICYYRDNEFVLADEKSVIKKGDEVIVLTHSKNLEELKDRQKRAVQNTQE